MVHNLISYSQGIIKSFIGSHPFTQDAYCNVPPLPSVGEQMIGSASLVYKAKTGTTRKRYRNSHSLKSSSLLLLRRKFIKCSSLLPTDPQSLEV